MSESILSYVFSYYVEGCSYFCGCGSGGEAVAPVIRISMVLKVEVTLSMKLNPKLLWALHTGCPLLLRDGLSAEDKVHCTLSE